MVISLTWKINDADATGWREGTLCWQNNEDAYQSETAPSVWDKKVVTYDPKQILVGVESESDDAPTIPTACTLAQNYPNPFNPVTNIEYSVSKLSVVSLGIYNVNGQLVKTLVNQFKEVGSHSVSWDGKNNSGEICTSGVYLYRLRTSQGKSVKTRKMLLLQ